MLKNYIRILICGLALCCNALPASANFLMSPSGATTAFAIDLANQGTSLCAAASTECPASVPINTAGAPLFTSAVPGVVNANAGTNLNTSLLALESGGNLATLAGAITAAVQQTNEKQINGVVPLMGNGVTGTGSQRVTIASDNTAFSVNAAITAAALPLPALASTSTKQSDGSQKTQIVDGSGNVIASTSNNLNVQCANCSGSGVSATDGATFTVGTSLMAPIGGQFTTGGATACVTGTECTIAATAARALFTNLASIAGTTTLTGTGAVGTGAQRVAVGTDTATIAGSAPGTAGTPSTNVVSIQGVASGTNLPVSQATAASLNATVVGTGTFAVQSTIATATGWGIIADKGTFTASTSPGNLVAGEFTTGGATACASAQACAVGMTASRGFFTDLSTVNAVTVLTGTGAVGTGAQRVAVGTDTATIAGSAPGTAGTASTNVLSVQGIASMTALLVNPGTIGTWGLAASTQNGTTPTNAGLVMGQFNTSPTTITTGNISPLQLDNAGNLLVNIKAGAGSGGTAITDNAAFTTGTTSETPIGCYAGTPSATANHSTIVACTTAGSVHTTVDNTNANGSAVSASSSPVVIASDQAAVAVKGNAASGSAVSGNPLLIAGSDGTNARSIATDTGGNQKVINGASRYQAVAASQTATVLQSSTGATGDYLSHCVIYPTSTSPGVVTVFDNTNTAANSAILFAGGATSTSNLTPITVPAGAVSLSGAWKVTTGANVSVVCVGKFS